MHTWALNRSPDYSSIVQVYSEKIGIHTWNILLTFNMQESVTETPHAVNITSLLTEIINACFVKTYF
jgi:hypothetical protein